MEIEEQIEELGRDVAGIRSELIAITEAQAGTMETVGRLEKKLAETNNRIVGIAGENLASGVPLVFTQQTMIARLARLESTVIMLKKRSGITDHETDPDKYVTIHVDTKRDPREGAEYAKCDDAANGTRLTKGNVYVVSRLRHGYFDTGDDNDIIVTVSCADFTPVRRVPQEPKVEYVPTETYVKGQFGDYEAAFKRVETPQPDKWEEIT
jgi:hypothetical protein